MNRPQSHRGADFQDLRLPVIEGCGGVDARIAWRVPSDPRWRRAAPDGLLLVRSTARSPPAPTLPSASAPSTMRLSHSLWIRSTPEAIFRFFEKMEDNYLRWHPDHRLFRWEVGRGLMPGVVFYFEEVIGGKLQRKRVEYTRIEAGRHIEFTFTSRLLRLILPGIRFLVEPEGEGVRFTQEIRVRTGPVGAWLNRREFDAVRQHMKEEGENLKQMLESAREV